MDISRHHQGSSVGRHAVLIVGALGAIVLGAMAALHLDLVVAAGERLMHPAGQDALIRTTAAAGLAGGLCWVACALVARAVDRAALRPYDALADYFEGLVDGDADGPV